MSSGSQREQPTGVIRQGNRVVGCIVMPEADDVFIREFNHCYGQLRLSVASTPNPIPKTTDPNTFQLPTWFRHVWHSVHPEPIVETSACLPSSESNKPTASLIDKSGISASPTANAVPLPTEKPSNFSKSTESTNAAGAKSKPRRRKPSEPRRNTEEG
ncbi:MAG: hypothetical protein FJ308_02670 [Planctomycetes bacterium]|nr:hypothetical protein [Planctomycetota bacterium]